MKSLIRFLKIVLSIISNIAGKVTIKTDSSTKAREARKIESTSKFMKRAFDFNKGTIIAMKKVVDRKRCINKINASKVVGLP